MAAFPFVGASYQARSRTLDAQRCLNLFVEMGNPQGTSKSPAALIGTPGMSLWSVLGTDGVRGLLRFSATQLVAVVGQNVYLVTTLGSGALVGTLAGLVAGTTATGTGPVSMASNGTLVMIVTGDAGYVLTPGLPVPTLARINSPNFLGADVVYFLDGYFVFNRPGTARFQITNLYGISIDGLAFATAEGAPDLLVTLIVDHRELWLLGENSTEIWFNSGNPDFPFERNQGAFIEVGCAAKYSAAKLDNAVIWLASDDRGQGMVVRTNGYQPMRISTHALEFALASYARIDDAVAWTYQQEGHSFYVLNLPSAGKTWVYDASTSLWHERAWRDPNGNLGRHRGQCQVSFANKILVGDWENGNISQLDLNVFTDNGVAIARIRACQHAAGPNMKRQYFTALQIDMEAGVGLSSGQGIDPQARLRWSDDGGFTWGNEMLASIGKVGEYQRRVRWRRLGYARDRVFEVTITDPVRVAIVGAVAEVQLEA